MRPWENEAHVELAVKLWKEGLSAAQVAAELSRTFADAAYSRSGVIGKMNRLGHQRKDAASCMALGARERAPKREPRVQARAFGETRVKPAMVFANPGSQFSTEPKQPYTTKDGAYDPLPDAPIRAWGEQSLTRHCAWPVEIDGKPVGCCGLEIAGMSWCATHLARGTTKPPPGKPRTGNELSRALRRFI